MEDSSASPSQMLRGRYMWWMESLTSSRSGMMAWHLSEVLRSHCDQILLCPCFIAVTAWGMLGFVLPTVAIHHLWRERESTVALCFPPPSHPSACTYTHTHTPTHAHTYPHMHTPFPAHSSLELSVETSCLCHGAGPLLFIYTSVVQLWAGDKLKEKKPTTTLGVLLWC